MMGVPDDIKENVRAVLLSKTDGSGILVSQFLKDYKSFVQQPLMLRKHGYDGLEQFLKDIPDVCRLEYSEKHMAYRLFGITKPNTFVSSFVKKAEGRESDSENASKKRNGEKFVPTMDLQEKWEPNERGLYSLCFQNKKNLQTKEAVALKFTHLGEVVEINIIERVTFVRYSDEQAAKKAIELYGEELGLKRAAERSGKRSRGNGRDRNANNNRHKVGNHHRSNPDETMNYNNNTVDDWDDVYTTSVPKSQASGGYPNKKSDQYESKKAQAVGYHSNTEDSQGISKTKDRRKMNSNYENVLPSPSSQSTENVDVYIGNWPVDADEKDLLQLLGPYKHNGCRLYTAKGSQFKKFAFVDCETLKDAHVIINSLDKTTFQDRTLHVRFGKKANTGNEHCDTANRDTFPKTGTERDSARISTRNDGTERDSARISTKNDGIDRDFASLSIKATPTNAEDKMPMLECIDAQCDLDMPPLENIQTSALSPSMPALENSHRRPGGMPALENSLRRPGGMPALENSHRRPGGMPALENSLRRPGGMPTLETISPSVAEKKTGVNSDVTSAQLNVGNFPYGTVERELVDLFYPFGARSVQVMNSDMTNRSAYAFVDFENFHQAMEAMIALDQTMFKNRKLVVTLSNTFACSQPKPEQRVEKRRIKDTDMTLSQISPISSTTTDVAFERSLQPKFNFQRLTCTLHDYSKIAMKLRAEELFQLSQGMTVKVMITHVENQKFFWGQVLEDSENGMNMDLQSLQLLADELQVEPKVLTTDGLGRCMAKYENEWFRAWNTCETQKSGQIFADLLFIDYGNRSLIPKREIFKSKSHMWLLPPMAKPFKLVDVKYDLEQFVNNVVVLEVFEPGCSRNNFVSSVQALQWSQ